MNMVQNGTLIIMMIIKILMVSYINNKVNALFSNQNIITSKSKIKYNTPKKWLNNVLVSQ